MATERVRYKVPRHEENVGDVFAALAQGYFKRQAQKQEVMTQMLPVLAQMKMLKPGSVKGATVIDTPIGKMSIVAPQEEKNIQGINPEEVNARTNIHKAAVSQAVAEFGGNDMMGITFSDTNQTKLFQSRIKEIEDQMLSSAGINLSVNSSPGKKIEKEGEGNSAPINKTLIITNKYGVRQIKKPGEFTQADIDNVTKNGFTVTYADTIAPPQPASGINLKSLFSKRPAKPMTQDQLFLPMKPGINPFEQAFQDKNQEFQGISTPPSGFMFR